MRKRAKVVWTNGRQRLVRLVERNGSRWVKRYIVEERTVDALGDNAWTKKYDLDSGWSSTIETDRDKAWLIRRMLIELAEKSAR